jgi:hypothetical protein
LREKTPHYVHLVIIHTLAQPSKEQYHDRREKNTFKKASLVGRGKLYLKIDKTPKKQLQED